MIDSLGEKWLQVTKQRQLCIFIYDIPIMFCLFLKGRGHALYCVDYYIFFWIKIRQTLRKKMVTTYPKKRN